MLWSELVTTRSWKREKMSIKLTDTTFCNCCNWFLTVQWWVYPLGSSALFVSCGKKQISSVKLFMAASRSSASRAKVLQYHQRTSLPASPPLQLLLPHANIQPTSQRAAGRSEGSHCMVNFYPFILKEMYFLFFFYPQPRENDTSFLQHLCA